MKKLLTIICALFVAVAIAQAATETVYLKNGSVIKGEVIEQVPGVSLKIRTKDGSIFVYNMDEVLRIAKEDVSSPDSKFLPYGGLEFSLNSGVNIATKGGGCDVPVNVLLSKRFSPNFSFGVGSGVVIPTGDGANPLIPIFADAKLYLPVTQKITPYINLQAGYMAHTGDGTTIKGDDYGYGVSVEDTHIDPIDYVAFSIIPSVRFALSHRVDVDFGVGYTHMVPTKGKGGSGAVALRLGLNFHKSNDPNKKIKEPKIPVPTRDKGFEFGLEGGCLAGYGLDALFGYKMTPQWSFALGVGIGGRSFTANDMTTTYYSELDGMGEVVSVTTRQSHDTDLTLMNIHLRGQYRFFNKKFSPIASVDIGYIFNLGERESGLSYWTIDDDWEQPKISNIFVRPMIGVSWRATKNSYLELKVGYGINGKSPTMYETKNDRRKNSKSYVEGFEGKSISSLALSLTWKHTFGLFSK